jgi:hypothetical protein
MEQALNGHRAHLQAAGHLSVAQALQHDELNHLPLAGIQTLEQGLHRFPLPIIPFDFAASLGPIEVVLRNLCKGLGPVEQPLPHQDVPLLGIDAQQPLQGCWGCHPTLLQPVPLQTHQPFLQFGLPAG